MCASLTTPWSGFFCARWGAATSSFTGWCWSTLLHWESYIALGGRDAVPAKGRIILGLAVNIATWTGGTVPGIAMAVERNAATSSRSPVRVLNEVASRVGIADFGALILCPGSSGSRVL